MVSKLVIIVTNNFLSLKLVTNKTFSCSVSFFFSVVFIISFSSNVQTRSLFEIRSLFPFSCYVSTFYKHLKVVQLLFFFCSLPYFPFLPQHWAMWKRAFGFFCALHMFDQFLFPNFTQFGKPKPEYAYGFSLNESLGMWKKVFFFLLCFSYVWLLLFLIFTEFVKPKPQHAYGFSFGVWSPNLNSN